MRDIAAVLVTRGDQDLQEILDSHAAVPEIAFTYIWDNSREWRDLSVFGRYAAIDRFDNPVVLVQDDDCVLDPESFATLISAYQPGVLTANMPARFRHDFYQDHCLVGFGAIFDRGLPAAAFRQYREKCGIPQGDSLIFDDMFLRNCDVVFTALTIRHLVDVAHRDLPWASNPERMWKQKDHQTSRSLMLQKALAAR